MRVLFVHQYSGPFGGAETNIHLTAAELTRRGHICGLLYSRSTGQTGDCWADLFSPHVCLGTNSPAKTLREVSEQFEPDVIYLHTMPHLEVIECLLRLGTPVVRMVHDHEMYCMRGYKYHPVTRKICTRPASMACVFPCLAPLTRNRSGLLPLKWSSYLRKRREISLNRRCARFIVYSDYSRQELIRNGFPPEKIHIHVPIRCWGTTGRLSSFADRNLVLFVGQIIRGKGVDVLLRALARVNVQFECVILGDGNHRAHCERLRNNLGLGSKVKFEGYVPRESLEEYYLGASVFVVSSVWPEPFGMVGPEAMRYGLPVVAFDAGGIREWLSDGQNGFLVPWMDTQTFATRVEQLLRDKPLARQMGRRGLEYVNREYSASCQIERLEAILHDITGDRRAPSVTHESAVIPVASPLPL